MSEFELSKEDLAEIERKVELYRQMVTTAAVRRKQKAQAIALGMARKPSATKEEKIEWLRRVVEGESISSVARGVGRATSVVSSSIRDLMFAYASIPIHEPAWQWKYKYGPMVLHRLTAERCDGS